MTGRLEAAGHGLHALLGPFSILAPKYLGTTGSNLGGGYGRQWYLGLSHFPSSVVRRGRGWGGGAEGHGHGVHLHGPSHGYHSETKTWGNIFLGRS
jgi:hypothetical protein